MTRKSNDLATLAALAHEIPPHDLIWLANEMADREETADLIRRHYSKEVAAKIDAILLLPRIARSALVQRMTDIIAKRTATSPPTKAAATKKRRVAKKSHQS